MSRKRRLVLVTWLDAFNASGWQDPKDVRSEAPLTVTSVGWLMRNDRTAAVLAQTVDPNDAKAEVAGVWTIPAGMVVSIQDLQVKEL